MTLGNTAPVGSLTILVYDGKILQHLCLSQCRFTKITLHVNTLFQIFVECHFLLQLVNSIGTFIIAFLFMNCKNSG